jgi:hypothetical protein
VCVCVQQNILNAEFKEDICWRSGNSVKSKATPGQPNPGTPLSKNKVSYKALVLTTPIAIVIPLTITQSPSWMLPNQVSYLKVSLMDSFTLGSTPKIDFTRTVEHIPTTARELADLRFSLNTISKHCGICYIIHTIYKPRALYLWAYKDPKSRQIRTLAVERPNGRLLRLDGLLRPPSRIAQFFP